MASLLGLDPKGIMDGALDIFNRFFPDKSKEEKEKMAAELQSRLQQLAVNAKEAESDNWFVAGWRPYVGWVCGTGLAYQFLIRPLFNGFVAVFHLQLGAFPSLDTGTLLQLLASMLGVGSLRTYEKLKGVQGNHN